ncbi:hypothetical protein I6E23_11435 [Prevotella brevis]|nr:hypothetical protein [Xylanibacter brevis]
MDKNTLYEALAGFNGVSDIKLESVKQEELSKQFSEVAKRIFNTGYFEVNGSRRIYPTVIEFYYHEEVEGGLEDPIMYHTNLNNKGQVDYYPFGSFNFHVSGLDVTFEKKDEYRASFLIREYDVYSLKDGAWIKDKSECRSTYIYEDMLMGLSVFDGISINWVTEQSAIEYSVTTTERKNVASYHIENNKYVKDEISNEDYKNLPDSKKALYFSYSGKKYKKCTRQWSYHRVIL